MVDIVAPEAISFPPHMNRSPQKEEEKTDETASATTDDSTSSILSSPPPKLSALSYPSPSFGLSWQQASREVKQRLLQHKQQADKKSEELLLSCCSNSTHTMSDDSDSLLLTRSRTVRFDTSIIFISPRPILPLMDSVCLSDDEDEDENGHGNNDEPGALKPGSGDNGSANSSDLTTWIDLPDLHQMQTDSKEFARSLRERSDHKDYATSLTFLSQRHSSAQRYELVQHVTRVIQHNADCRGLERFTCPQLVVRARRATRDIVLQYQEQLRRDGLWGTNMAHELLRDQYLSSSFPLRQLAFRLGQADELQVQWLRATEEKKQLPTDDQSNCSSAQERQSLGQRERE